ncbi:MAG: FtsB family cell division protein [Bacteroidota bacterium]
MNILLKLFRNKYFIAILIFFIWILLFDRNNLIDKFKTLNQLEQLKKEKQYYLEKIDYNKARIEELKTDKENLEKFAREQYLMKKEDEDIFIVVEEDDKQGKD